jgi:hypothetical protein
MGMKSRRDGRQRKYERVRITNQDLGDAIRRAANRLAGCAAEVEDVSAAQAEARAKAERRRTQEENTIAKTARRAAAAQEHGVHQHRWKHMRDSIDGTQELQTCKCGEYQLVDKET